MYLSHILHSCTGQYECDDVLDGFGGPGEGFQLDTGSKTVPGQIFASIIFCSLGFICEYSENLYTAKISMCMVYQSLASFPGFSLAFISPAVEKSIFLPQAR